MAAPSCAVADFVDNRLVEGDFGLELSAKNIQVLLEGRRELSIDAGYAQ